MLLMKVFPDTLRVYGSAPMVRKATVSLFLQMWYLDSFTLLNQWKVGFLSAYHGLHLHFNVLDAKLERKTI